GQALLQEEDGLGVEPIAAHGTIPFSSRQRRRSGRARETRTCSAGAFSPDWRAISGYDNPCWKRSRTASRARGASPCRQLARARARERSASRSSTPSSAAGRSPISSIGLKRRRRRRFILRRSRQRWRAMPSSQVRNEERRENLGSPSCACTKVI